MPYTLELDPASRSIKLTLTGLLTQPFRREVLVALASKQNICGFSNALIDVCGTAFSPNEPMMNALDLITFMTTLGFLPQSKLAFVYGDAHDYRQFFADMAQTQGFNIRYFEDADEAKAWLLENQAIFQ